MDAPVLASDAGRPLALRWLGHEASDEFTAMLAVNRARDWKTFQLAFRTFAVPGQNMLYADATGNIGQLLAVKLLRRDHESPPDLVLDGATEHAGRWDVVEAGSLPFEFNPRKGYLVSANNRPTEMPTPVGYFFSSDDRVHQITEPIDANAAVGVADLQAIQRDVTMPSAIALRDAIVERSETLGLTTQGGAQERAVIELLRNWDGRYSADSRGALAFEVFLDQFAISFYDQAKARAYFAIGRMRQMLLQDIPPAPSDKLSAAIRHSLNRSVGSLAEFQTWGDMHRLRLSHPLGLIPFIGAKYRFADHPSAGGVQTVMKTAHGAPVERHATRYGSNARHISDMADVDRNYFALLGGQDGWFRSTTFLDQVRLWLEGAYVQVPLRLSTVRETFRHRTVLSPADG